MRQLLLGLVIVLSGSVAMACSDCGKKNCKPPARTCVQDRHCHNHGWRGWGWGHRGWGWGRYHHASTAAQGLLDGRANYLRGAGEFMLLRARANRESERAKQEAIRTDKMRVNWFFEKQYVNRNWVEKLDEQRRERIENQKERRKQEVENYVLRNARDNDELHDEVDMGKIFASIQNNGQIQWPALMYDPVFDQHRKTIENIFKQVAAGKMHQETARGTLRYIISVQPQYNTLQVLKETLHRHRLPDGTNAIPSQHYIEAKRFLQSLMVQ